MQIQVCPKGNTAFPVYQSMEGKDIVRDTFYWVRLEGAVCPLARETAPRRHSGQVARTRILIADDHEIFRKGLRSLIDACPNWEICGEASNGIEAVESARKLAPDIVIMDLSMPQVNGLDAMKRILKEMPKTRVVILTQHDSAYMLTAAMQAGALAYVTKSQVAHYLLEALDAVAAGKPYGWGGGLSTLPVDFPETNLKPQSE